MKRRNRKRNSKAARPAKIPVDAEKAAGPSAAPAGADRRTHPRYEFVAAVEVGPRVGRGKLDDGVHVAGFHAVALAALVVIGNIIGDAVTIEVRGCHRLLDCEHSGSEIRWR